MARGEKMLDEEEAVRLIVEEGYKSSDMVLFYREKYGIDTTLSMWSHFKRRRGIGGNERAVYPHVFPWRTRLGLGNAGRITALIAMHKIALGEEVSVRGSEKARKLERDLREWDKVVSYNPRTNDVELVPYRPGVDYAWIRNPLVNDDGSPVEDAGSLSLRPEGLEALRSGDMGLMPER